MIFKGAYILVVIALRLCVKQPLYLSVREDPPLPIELINVE